MKTFFILAAAAVLASAQQVTNPQPFARGPAPAIDGTARGGQAIFGNVDIPLERIAPVNYVGNDGQTPFDDGITVNGAAMPNVRAVSNIVVGNSSSVVNNRRAISSYHTFWGQFMDHDLGLTEGVPSAGSFNIVIPTGDGTFTPGLELSFNRAIHVNDTMGVRQQINEITAWMDASNVYGSTDSHNMYVRGRCIDDDSECAGGLLMFDENGSITRQGLLPTVAQVNADLTAMGVATVPQNELAVGQGDFSDSKVGGDIRAQENNALESVHTIWTREHNRCAEDLRGNGRTSQQVHDECRFFVMAYMTNVNWNEYAPLLLPSTFDVNGVNRFNPDWTAYNPMLRPDVFNEFSGALFRYGHSELPTAVPRADPLTNNPLTEIDLRVSFLNPTMTPTPDSIDEILAGLWQQQQNLVDVFVVDDIRNALFRTDLNNADTGNDLISFNLQRSRDHGLPFLNDLRSQLGLTPYTTFQELTGETAPNDPIAQNLAAVYTVIDNVELWVGAVAEPQFQDGNFGETLTRVISEQYTRFRDADNYYYENGWFSASEVTDIQNTLLSTIILRNSDIAMMPCNVMEFDPNGAQTMCENMNGAASITFGVFSVFATLAAFLF